MQQRLEKLTAALQCATMVESTLRERGVLLDGDGSEELIETGGWNIVGQIRPFDVGTERVKFVMEVEIGNVYKRNGADVDAVALTLTIKDMTENAAGECSIDAELFLSPSEARLYTTWDGLELLGHVENCFAKNGLKYSDYNDPHRAPLSDGELQSVLYTLADIVREAKLLVR